MGTAPKIGRGGGKKKMKENEKGKKNHSRAKIQVNKRMARAEEKRERSQ